MKLFRSQHNSIQTEGERNINIRLLSGHFEGLVWGWLVLRGLRIRDGLREGKGIAGEG